MSIRDLLTVVCSFALIPVVAGNLSQAAEDWWENTPNYEEDAWYDVTEWFDGNDYRYVQENDSDNNSYDGYDYDWDYDYDYGYDPSFGYNDRYAADDWFYDYWDDGYAYYRDWDNDGNYDYSASYYDYDGDGAYDAWFGYHDWNDDGIFDDVDFYSFNDSKDNANQASRAKAEKSKSSQREMVQGEVVKTKKSTVRDTKHLIVKIEKSDGNQCTVDLGPANKLQNLDIAEGDQISVRGPMTKVGDQKVLIAQELKVGGNSQGLEQIDRDGQQYRGKVADTRTSKMQGRKHSFVILTSANNKKKLVDLGPADALSVNPQQGDQITVTAAPVKVNDRIVLMAQEVRCNGKKCEVDRSHQKSSQQSDSQADRQNRENSRDHQASSERHSRSATGKVQGTREITVRGNDRKVATIKTQNGDRILVDLGPAGGFDEHLRNGDTITVRGPMTKSNDKLVLLARSLERDGEKINLGRRGTQHSDATQKTISGKIESTRKATVHGKQRQLAKVETDQGKSVVVDLGAPTVLDMDLAEGDQLTASGALVKAGNQVVLIAYEVEDQNGGMIAIDRRETQSRDAQ